MSKANSDQWHWDNDRHRWIFMGSSPTYNPTYRWELHKDEMVYENELMMEAIDLACNNMTRFPDAERILQDLDNETKL